MYTITNKHVPDDSCEYNLNDSIRRRPVVTRTDGLNHGRGQQEGQGLRSFFKLHGISIDLRPGAVPCKRIAFGCSTLEPALYFDTNEFEP